MSSSKKPSAQAKKPRAPPTPRPRPPKAQASMRSVQKVSPPVSLGEIQKTQFAIKAGTGKADCCVMGRDYVSTFTVPTTSVPGQTIINFPISPSSLLFAGTRLSLFGQMFEKFKFRKLALHATASSSTSIGGSIVLAYDHDASDASPPATDQGVRSLLAYQDNVSGPVWSNLSLRCSVEKDPQKFYYTNYLGSDERLSDEGQAYVCCLVTPTSNASFSLWVEYEVDLFEPQLDQSQFAELNYANATGTPFSTMTTGVNDGFNWINQSASALKASSGLYKVITDPQGATYVDISKAGTYLLDQVWSLGSGLSGTANFLASVLVPKDSTETGSVSVLDNYGSALVNGNSVSRFEKIVVPTHGARLYGNSAFASGAPGAATFRLLKAFSTIV